MSLSNQLRVGRTHLPFLVVMFLLLLAGNVRAASQPYLADHQVNFGTGNKYLTATDISLSGPSGAFSFTRTYNSQSATASVLGYGWTATFSERLVIESSAITLVQEGGRHVVFRNDGTGNWINETGKKRTIVADSGGYRLTEPNGTLRQYDSSGRLVSVTDRNSNTRTYAYTGDLLASISDNFSQSLTFSYTSGKLTGVAATAGTWTYGYQNDNLVQVGKPDGTTIQYLYDDAHNLTGIIDESGTRTLTVTYDAQDRVIGSAKANGIDAVTIAYPATMTREVTDSLGVKTTYQLDTLHGVVMVGSMTGPGCTSCGSNANTQYLYDNRLQILEATDGNGVKTIYTYDQAGNRTRINRAAGTPLAQVTTTTYTAKNELATITEPSVANPGQNRVTTNTYDDHGNLLSRTISGYDGSTAITATTSFTYNGLGQIISVDGPRTDIDDTLTLSYYPNEAGQGNNRGQLHIVTNPLGQNTTYGDYTPLGKPGTITDANGLATTLSYDVGGRLLTRTTGGLTTGYAYDSAGRLLTLTLPGSRTLAYTYAGDQVAVITDGMGNAIHYSYDTKGQKIKEELHDPAGSLTFALGLAYDAAGNLGKRLYPGNGEESYTYDAVRNLVQAIDPTGMQTDYGYDGLNRLLSVTEAGTAVAAIAYDSHDNRTQVTDARGKITRFTYDDLGRLRTVTAPDTGLTSAAHDAAGNLLTLTDARQTVSFAYDALNRPIRQSYPGAARDLLFGYDQPAIGKLTQVQEEESNRSFAYNSLGQLTAETRTLGGTTATIGYGYDSASGELASMTYPSGRVLTFSRDATGRIVGLAVDGVPLAADIQYLPFGPVRSASLGSLSLTRSHDQRYQVSRIQAGGLDYTYTRDQAGQVTGITGVPVPAATGATETATISPDNNQVTGIDGSVAKTYSHDAAGNVASDGVFAYTWDGLNRLVKVEKAGAIVATYGYDSGNRRIRKTVGNKTIHYHYDQNNLLIAETLADGTPLRDYFYLNNEPLALREYETSPGLYYFLNDHLGTPQQLVKADGTKVWQAAYLPYGQAQVQTVTVANNLRFPGQYFDTETGLHYNWNRYYDPTTGRYISSDPIGLAGGMNLYGYVQNDPVNRIDPLGLMSESEIRGLVEANNQSSLSTELILCIIYKESTFNPDAKRSDNGSAKGLMGVTDGSAEWVGYSASTMFNPTSNIKAGTKLLNRFTNWKAYGNGDVAKGLFTYGTRDQETPVYSKQILDCEKCLKNKSEGKCDNHDDCYKPLHKQNN